LENNGHHTGLAHQRAIEPAFERCRRRAFTEVVIDLPTRIAQTGDFDDGIRTEPQARAARQREQGDAARGYVFSKLAGRDIKPHCCKLTEQLGVDQVNLAQVRRTWGLCQTGEMLHGLSGMGVAFDAQSRDEADRSARLLGEAMPIVARDGDYLCIHGSTLSRLAPEQFRHRIELCEIATGA
jgi:hypothetical protein